MQSEDDNLKDLRPSTRPLLDAGLCSHPDYCEDHRPFFNYNSIPEIKALKIKASIAELDSGKCKTYDTIEALFSDLES